MMTRRGSGHATFAGAPVGGFDHAARGIFHVSVGHDENVILRAAVGLDALAVPRADFKDVTRHWR